MQARHSAVRSAGVSAVVEAGWDIPGWSAETGGGINDKIGDSDRGGLGRDPNWITGRGEEESQEASRSSGALWIRVEQIVAVRRTDEHAPTPTMVKEHYGTKVAILNLRGTEYSAFIAVVLSWNSTNHC